MFFPFLNRLEYELAYARKIYYKVKQRYLHIDNLRNHYSGKSILNNAQGNNEISNLLEGTAPFMVTRFGSIELACVVNFLDKKMRGAKLYKEKTKFSMQNNAGFFPCEELMLDKFSQTMLNDMKEIDLLGTWNINLEDYLVKVYCKKTVKLARLSALEPFFLDDPWSAKLTNKRVLVIHPYKDSILSQYKKREKLFPNRNILPDFDLQVIRAVQSIAGNKTNFNNWFEALDSMCEQIERTEFDVAIIGAGAYGLPLAAYVKRLGKQAIHMGGSSQLLFGIRGKRWDSREHSKLLYNDYWVSPGNAEKPGNAVLVEGGCYW